MTHDEKDRLDDVLALLGEWRRRQRRQNGMPDPMQLAAWLEGRVSEAEAVEVERALAADPVLLQVLLAGYQVPTVTPAATEIAAARALVQNRRDGFARLREWMQPLLQPSVAVIAVLLVVVGTGGFEIGQAMAGMALAQQESASLALLTDALSPLNEEG